MDQYTEYFKNKKITVMGMGVLGGIGNIKYLAEAGADLVVTDLKTEEELAPVIAELKAYPNIRYTLDHHEFEDFRGRDLVIKAPSTPVDSPYISEAKSRGIPVTMWASLFCRFAKQAGATIVGVTGTRGKTTTTELLVHIARAASLAVIEGGNLQGTALLSRLSELTPSTVVILELDSWKLQGFKEEHISPTIAVFTNLYADHLNYYQGYMHAYLEDKAQIFLNQREGDTLILGSQVEHLIQTTYLGRIRGTVRVAGANDFPTGWQLNMPGEHNRHNAACALFAARALKIDDAVSKQAIETFEAIEGRLQFVREVDGVRIYNDTTATTPDATMAGLSALDPTGQKNITLIMGGADKNLDMSPLLPEIEKHVRHVSLLAGTGTARIAPQLKDARVFENLQDALGDALAHTPRGGILLFSPAFASFGMFKNEYDRGDQFMELIAQLP